MVIIAGMPGLMRSPAALPGVYEEEVLTALRDAVEVYADTGAEVIRLDFGHFSRNQRSGGTAAT